MSNRGRIIAGVLGLLCACGARAQDFGTGIEAAQAKIEAKQWKDALELLLPLQGAAELREDLEVLAARLGTVGEGLVAEANFEQALRACSATLATQRRLHGDRDHPEVAKGLHNVASCQLSLGRAGEALPQFESALAMRQRLYGDRDHPSVAQSLSYVASCLKSLGRVGEALPRNESTLAMQKRLYGDRDHPEVATSLNNVAYCLERLGRGGEALPQFESALAMRQRLYGDRDHPEVATSLNNVASCLLSFGREVEALPRFESALAMQKRLYADRDHPDVATSLNSVAECLQSLGRAGEALPQFESALAMQKRLFGDRDDPELAASLESVAACLQSLGRAGEALPQFESALAMRKRLSGDRDDPEVAASLNSVAACLQSLGRAGEALPQFESALAMRKRLYGDHDHPEVAAYLNNIAVCLQVLGRAGEALPQYESALAMSKRLYGDRDHPDVANSMTNLAYSLLSLGRAGEALPQFESALAMRNRLYGDRDHPELALSLSSVASCLQSLGRAVEALPRVEQAVAMIERLRNDTRTSPELRQSFFEDLKRGRAFERFQHLARQLGRSAEALYVAERSRGRELLDALEQFADPEAEAQRRARLRGDDAAATRLAALRSELDAVRTESDRLLHELTRLADFADAAQRDEQRGSLHARSNANSQQLRQLLDERARLLGDVLPVGRVITPADIQSCLAADELLLEFTVDGDGTLLYVVAHEGEVQIVELPRAFATARRVVPQLLRQASHAQLRGRDPEPGDSAPSPEVGKELFASLFPAPVWERVRSSKRVFVAAHRDLHRVPFELLVTDVKDGKSVHWLDAGPPISYVPSGTMLHWLRKRSREAGDDTTSLDLLAIGDPRRLDAAPEVPERGVFVVAVKDGGEGARIGLQPGDVLVSYDRQPLTDDKALRDLRMATERAIEDQQRDGSPIPIGVWRRGATLTLEGKPGPLGIQVGAGRARSAFEARLGGEAQLERITRSGDLERIGGLSPLHGARAEAGAIEAVFAGKERKTKHLFGADATEPAVFDLASKAKYLHFACHGIAEEYAGQSFSMLVLSQPEHVLPGDDGLLKLGDLFNAWRGRLPSCRLVVLSACRTNVGPTLRDEAPQALPIGFLFAGAPAVISTLWPVDDASTKELMADFYGRLLSGETDKLAAFTAAKKALRQKYPDPFHWAPFLYIGSPD